MVNKGVCLEASTAKEKLEIVLSAPFPAFTQEFRSGRQGEAGGREIRYEEKSSISVSGFVLQHHPNNVHHLSAKADERLAL